MRSRPSRTEYPIMLRIIILLAKVIIHWFKPGSGVGIGVLVIRSNKHLTARLKCCKRKVLRWSQEGSKSHLKRIKRRKKAWNERNRLVGVGNQLNVQQEAFKVVPMQQATLRSWPTAWNEAAPHIEMRHCNLTNSPWPKVARIIKCSIQRIDCAL